MRIGQQENSFLSSAVQDRWSELFGENALLGTSQRRTPSDAPAANHIKRLKNCCAEHNSSLLKKYPWNFPPMGYPDICRTTKKYVKKICVFRNIFFRFCILRNNQFQKAVYIKGFWSADTQTRMRQRYRESRLRGFSSSVETDASRNFAFMETT